MPFMRDHVAAEPARAEVDAQSGWLLLEFGAPWCGHCRAAQPAIRAWLDEVGDVTHLKVEDGKGRPLGRTFDVRLWPTLVVLADGQERARVVRPFRRGACTLRAWCERPPGPVFQSVC